jgi:RIO kinase 1
MPHHNDVDRFDRDEPQPLRRRPPNGWDEFSAAPPAGDRWSNWDGARHGPTPRPSWVITESAAVDHELGIVKSGKEADVYLIEREIPDTDRGVRLAAKRYREHKSFHRDTAYLEGRRVRESRQQRAMSNRTRFGRTLLAGQWAAAEFDVLCAMWEADAPVPYPVQLSGTELLMEFIGDEAAAPRLAETRPDAELLESLWEQCVHAMSHLARAGLAHGDLSPYNLLVHRGCLVMIDVPQAVDLVANPNGLDFLYRDAANVASWFAARGLARADADVLMAELIVDAGL